MKVRHIQAEREHRISTALSLFICNEENPLQCRGILIIAKEMGKPYQNF